MATASGLVDRTFSCLLCGAGLDDVAEAGARRGFRTRAALSGQHYWQLEATIFTAETAKDIVSAPLPVTVTLWPTCG